MDGTYTNTGALLLMLHLENALLFLVLFSLMLQLNQELDQEESRSFRYQVSSPVANSPPGWFFEMLHIPCAISIFKQHNFSLLTS